MAMVSGTRYREFADVKWDSIVLVHGLFGHAKKSWSLNVPNRVSGEEPVDSNALCNSSDESGAEKPPRKKRWTKGKDLFHEVFWPRDLLPKVFPNARVLTWGYDVQIEQLFSATSQASIFHHAETLLADLVMLRNTEARKSKPLLFIAHSLGGIVVKDALSLSKNEKAPLCEILPASIGVMFLGTPHHGSSIASLGKKFFEISQLFFQKPNLQVLSALESNSEILERISRSFTQVLSSSSIKVHSFREELPTKGRMIVTPASAAIGYLHETQGSLYANHRSMAKFSSVKDIKFERVTSVLQRWVEEAPIVQSTTKEAGNLDGPKFDKQLQLCLRSLSFAEAEARFEGIEVAYHQTYTWIFDPQIGLADWLEGKSRNNIFWIQGKPGSGKSTAMKFAISQPLTLQLLQKYSDSHWIVASFFFHDRGTSMQKSGEGFLCNILYQILSQQQSLFPVIYDLLARETVAQPFTIKFWKSQWTLSRLREVLMTIGQKSTSKVNLCLFVDALDEHNGSYRELVDILMDIAQLTNNPTFRVRLILAGRPENVFRTAFRDCPGFAIHEHTENDIRNYVDGRLQKEMCASQPIEGDIQLSNLVGSVVQLARGVFLWVKLAVNELVEGLCEGDTLEELDILLSTIPTELEDLYKRALRRYPRSSSRSLANNRYEAYVMFQLASCALTPFRLYDFLAAAHCLCHGTESVLKLAKHNPDQMERRLTSRCMGLLEAETVGNGPAVIVQFMHQTVKEFVHSDEGRSAIREGIPNLDIEGGTCLIFKYMLKLIGSLDTKTLNLNPIGFMMEHFASYANVLEWDEEVCVANEFEMALQTLKEIGPRQMIDRLLDDRMTKKAQGFLAKNASLEETNHTELSRECCYYLLDVIKDLFWEKNNRPWKSQMHLFREKSDHPWLSRMLDIFVEVGIVSQQTPTESDRCIDRKDFEEVKRLLLEEGKQKRSTTPMSEFLGIFGTFSEGTNGEKLKDKSTHNFMTRASKITNAVSKES
ncbi:uncharacterized protein KY384_006749 [Bacidia gigantensis]|uniref:uncharacterized protein n=1 Tax=Bacidia gigantensis TaxID=2732470 RepID=UPI001D052067|nr:uncharacterized protein KY384_006749 [Bacidia gigantensis]KAG8527833.1 hypothetical protein KY384_006749 [Bacidia gigantensis]